MERPSINEVLMGCALDFAERSTCQRIKAGAVIAVEGHIVSTGYNGNAPGKEHCCDYFENLYYKEPALAHSLPTYEDYLQSETFKKVHHEWALSYELHAEMNAIIYAAKRGIEINGADIYTTYSPCIFCTKAIIQAGIKKVYYHTLYERKEGLESLEILKNNNIKLFQIKLED